VTCSPGLSKPLSELASRFLAIVFIVLLFHRFLPSDRNLLASLRVSGGEANMEA